VIAPPFSFGIVVLLHLFNNLLEVQLHNPNVAEEVLFLLHLVEETDGFAV
jgi:hypothetical protein